MDPIGLGASVLHDPLVKSLAANLSGVGPVTAVTGPKVGFLKSLVEFIFHIMFLLVLIPIVYLVFRAFWYGYPRPFFFGHSENLPNVMKEYVTDFVATLNYALKHPCAMTPDVQSLVAANAESSRVLLGKPGPLVDLTVAPDDTSAETQPFLYAYFAFVGKDSREPPILKLAEALLDQSAIGKAIQSYTISKDAPPPGLERDLQRIDSFMKAAQSAKVTTSTDLTDLRLAVMCQDKDFIKNLRRMYDFRKSGGVSNTKIFHLMMGDYISYIFADVETGAKGMLPKVWEKFPKQIQEWFMYIWKTITSDKVNQYFMKLPQKISGVEKFIPPPGASLGDTVETFGFLKPFMAIPQFFISLVGVAKALAQAITNPLKAVMIIVGLVVGTMLFILYKIVVLFSVLYYIPAFFIALFINVYHSVWWVVIFVIIGTFYAVMWLLDVVTGGLILKLFRCESAPTRWFTQPNYFFGNKYMRSVFCSVPCASKYEPDDKGSWCNRSRTGRPTLCPQQQLFAVINALQYQKPLEYNLSSFKFVLPYAYFNQNESGKKTILKTFYKDKNKFLFMCGKFKPLYQSYALNACQYLHALSKKEGISDADKFIIQQGLSLCQSTFCGYRYDKTKLVESAATTYAFCPTLDQDKEPAKEVEPRNAVKVLAINVFLTVIAMVIWAVVYRLTNDPTFDFRKIMMLG